MFGADIVEGRGNDFIRDRHSIALTQTLARRLFGNTPATGKIITLRVDDTTAYPTVVSNVFKDFPATSHLRVDGVMPIPADFLKSFLGDNYGILLGPTYLRLRPNPDIAALDSALTKTVHTKNSGIDLRLQPLSEIHTRSTDLNYDPYNADKIDGKYIRIFIIVALSIFIIACFNFINLTIAIAAWRGKEIAVKKIMGAGRNRIMTQVLTETFLAAIIALLVAILLAYILLPALNGLLGRHLDAAILCRPAALVTYAAILLATTLFAGGYPALLISSSRIGQALKSNVLFHGSRTTLRNVLVTGQFTIAVVFIVSLIVFLKQLHFLQNKDLGYSYDQIVSIPLNSKAQLKIDGIRSELAKINGVNATAFGWTELGSGGALMGVDYTTAKGEQTRMSVNFENASSNYLRFFQMKVIRGSDFSKDPQNEYIINETLARQLGFANPIGRSINMAGMSNGHIVGVVKDYNYSSLRSRIEPLLIGSFPEGAGWKDNLYLKVSTANISATLKEAGAAMASVTGEGTPEWRFLDEHFRELYRSERQASTIIGIIGALAIGIACLGLLGLAAFVIVHRAKEISIRKVLGASVTGLAMQLSASFLKWVAVAFVIATPITWWLTNSWLQNFAYRISVSGWMFVAAAVVAVGTALLTVGVLAIKAAMANPVNNLRSE
jgi:putative ABC transport system permease protein